MYVPVHSALEHTFDKKLRLLNQVQSQRITGVTVGLAELLDVGQQDFLDHGRD